MQLFVSIKFVTFKDIRAVYIESTVHIRYKYLITKKVKSYFDTKNAFYAFGGGEGKEACMYYQAKIGTCRICKINLFLIQYFQLVIQA